MKQRKRIQVGGILPENSTLLATRPFRKIHHATDTTELIGGSPYLHLGDLALAHNGVLFLDELPEFEESTLDALYEPLATGKARVSNGKATIAYPVSCLLTASMSPCPCGYRHHPEKMCSCTPTAIKNHISCVPQTFLNQFDLHIQVIPNDDAHLSDQKEPESSEIIAQRVFAAREIQQTRFADFENVSCNAEMTDEMVQEFCTINNAEQIFLNAVVKKKNLSRKAYHKMLRTARTIADLAQSEKIKAEHLAEGLQYTMELL